MADEPATKEFVDRAVAAERRLTDEMFRQRDKAIELIASKVPLYISIAGMLMAAWALLKK
jgi:hypothetical protein